MPTLHLKPETKPPRPRSQIHATPPIFIIPISRKIASIRNAIFELCEIAVTEGVVDVVFPGGQKVAIRGEDGGGVVGEGDERGNLTEDTGLGRGVDGSVVDVAKGIGHTCTNCRLILSLSNIMGMGNAHQRTLQYRDWA